jgi:hypothetical protein
VSHDDQFPQAFSAAKLLINGKASANGPAAGAPAEMNSYQRLMQGMRINGVSLDEAATADQTMAMKDSANVAAAEETPKAPALLIGDNGQEAAYNFVKFLNENVAPRVESSNGYLFEGWSLGRNYSKSLDTPMPGPPLKPIYRGAGKADDDLTGFWWGDSEMDKALQLKMHQGLLTNWTYTNPKYGSTIIKPEDVDLNEIYDKLRSASSNAAKPLNNPSGNLVDTTA